MPIAVRPLVEADWPAVLRVTNVVFGQAGSAEHDAVEQQLLESDRVFVADTGGDAGDEGVVGSTASYPFRLTVPGGRDVPVGGVTNVGVLPTHRRQGILRAMMLCQLDDLAGRGEVAAVLNASEAGIYGRFGYGLASRYAVLHLDPARVAWLGDGSASAAPGVRLRRGSEVVDELRARYDATRLDRPGSLTRSEAWWSMLVGEVEIWKGGGPFEAVLVDGDDGVDDEVDDGPGGYALYRPVWKGDDLVIDVREVVASSPAQHLALWRYLTSIDLATRVAVEAALDDPLPWALLDPRVVRTREVRDFLFARLLDVPAALSARTYPVEVDVVFDVHDPVRSDVAGRYRLRGGPDGATCERIAATGPASDVELGVTELGALWLGGVAPSWLAASGRLHARPEVVARLDLAMRSTPEPFCATRF